MEGKQIMNLPNRLTMLRIILIPFIIAVSYFFKNKIIISDQDSFTLSNLIVLIIFCVASFTDFLDGHIARKYNLVTDFGKFMDPLADKLLVFSAFIILIEANRIAGWIVMAIIARELMVTGIRLLAASNHVVIAASKLGKAKTISQMITIIVLLFGSYPETLLHFPLGTILAYIAAFLTIISGIDYFVKNKEVILKK